MERLDCDLMFRWFVGLFMNDKVWVHSVFSKNRDHLMSSEGKAVPHGAYLDEVFGGRRVTCWPHNRLHLIYLNRKKKMKQKMKNALLIAASSMLFYSIVFAQDDVALVIDGQTVDFLSGDVAEHEALTLRIVAPDGRIWHGDFAWGNLPAIKLSFVFDDDLPDGRYNYTIIPHMDLADDTVAPEHRGLEPPQGPAPNPKVGTFTVTQGLIVDPNLPEDGPDSWESSHFYDSMAKRPTGTDIRMMSQTINDDLIVQGSICVGFDCLSSESFGFDTLRLKENNLRIAFIDTSTAGGFPAGDWQLRANDSASGGADHFSIDWLGFNAANGNAPVSTPFRVDGEAPTNAFRIASSGRVGLGTSNPILNMHIETFNTPGIRLEQNEAGPWGPYTWDIAGNETNFFVRDVTNGSSLPLRIRPGAPTSSLDIAATGDVGIGTASPSAALHVRRNPGSIGDRQMLRLENNGGSRVDFVNLASGNNWRLATEHNTGSFIITRIGSGAIEMRVDSAGNVTIPGVLSQGSDINDKRDITPVNAADILEHVMELPIAFWRYRNDDSESLHIGPMAQDFARIFGVGSDETRISTLDTSGVALAAVQAVTAQLTEKQASLNSVMADNARLKEENAALEERLARLERVVQQVVAERQLATVGH